MADTLGMADLRGMDVDKLAKGFADEEFIFKNFLTVTPTSARELRWYQKTAGVLDSTDTSGITASQLVGVAWGALPPVVEQSATRMTSYVKHFIVESPWFSDADVRDTDLDMLAINIRDLTRAIANQVDYRILDVLSGTVNLSGSAAGTGWSDGTNGNPFLDLLSGSTEIRANGYDISGTVAWVHPQNYKACLNYFVTTKGSSIPAFSSEKVTDGVLTKIANVRIVVSNNATRGQVLMITPQRSATWKTFTPITAVTETKPLIGVKIRVAEDGEVIFTDPKSAYLIKGVG